MKELFTFLLVFLSILAFGQFESEHLEQLAEIYIEENEDVGDFTEVYEWMQELYTNKLNLNKAELADLINLPFLKTNHITQILEHRSKFGNFLSVYELQVLPDFSKEIINRLLPFVFIIEKKESLAELIKDSKQQLFLRYQENFEKPKGFNSGVYKGAIGKTFFRYQNVLGKRASFGFVVENDAYEPVFKRGNIIDYLSMHFQLKETGIFKNIVIGDYQANFGQGLILGAGFGGFKSYEATTIGSVNQGVKKYSSVNENLFFRGVAATIKLKRLEFTPFYSINRIDASIENSLDTLDKEEFFFRNTQTSGFHRTEVEIENKDKLLKTDLGLNLNNSFGKLNIGLTYLNTQFSENKRRGERLYQLLELNGNRFSTFGLNYNYIYKNAFFSGEFALQNGDKVSTVNKLLLSLSSKSNALLIYRNYAPGYFSPNGKSFGEKANLSNEKGVYLGVNSTINYQWSFSIYGDFYSFPWLRYGVYSPSRGKDLAIKVNRLFSKSNNLYFRFKTESYGVSSGDHLVKQTIKARQIKSRAHFNYSLSPNIIAATRMELSSYEEQRGFAKSNGILFFQEFRFSLSRKWRASIRGVVFHTEDYRSRIYTYEHNVMYNFTIPALYDKGVRTYLLLQYKPLQLFSIQAKIGRISYFDREKIGSGNDAIEKSHKTSLTIQASLKL